MKTTTINIPVPVNPGAEHDKDSVLNATSILQEMGWEYLDVLFTTRDAGEPCEIPISFNDHDLRYVVERERLKKALQDRLRKEFEAITSQVPEKADAFLVISTASIERLRDPIKGCFTWTFRFKYRVVR